MSYCYYWSCFISYYDTSLCCILCIAILLRIILLRCVLPLRVITSSIVLHHVTFFLLPLRGLIIHIYSLTLFLLFIHLDLFHFLCCSITLYFISYNLLFALSYFTISYAASPNIHASLQYFAYIFIQLHRVFLTNDFIDYHRNCFMYITIILFSLRHFNFTLVITHLRCMIYWCFVVTVFFTSSYYTISYAASPNLHASLRYSTYVFIHLHRVFLTNDFFDYNRNCFLYIAVMLFFASSLSTSHCLSLVFVVVYSDASSDIVTVLFPRPIELSILLLRAFLTMIETYTCTPLLLHIHWWINFVDLQIIFFALPSLLVSSSSTVMQDRSLDSDQSLDRQAHFFFDFTSKFIKDSKSAFRTACL